MRGGELKTTSTLDSRRRSRPRLGGGGCKVVDWAVRTRQIRRQRRSWIGNGVDCRRIGLRSATEAEDKASTTRGDCGYSGRRRLSRGLAVATSRAGREQVWEPGCVIADFWALSNGDAEESTPAAASRLGGAGVLEGTRWLLEL
ncbi:hypothetical protein M0R45_031274 [Rubus argutus]|uniref:Uncharacterized protein n=1 Tax=Rubus argutus TaxID=59490 RepID=A0AAW1WHU9_RUBAR